MYDIGEALIGNFVDGNRNGIISEEDVFVLAGFCLARGLISVDQFQCVVSTALSENRAQGGSVGGR